MPSSPFTDLDFQATDVATVEHNVLAEAEANALRLEAKEQEQLLSVLDDQLIQLRKQERILSSARFSTAGNRQLQSLRTRIQNVQSKRAKLVEAAEARKEIRDKLPEREKAQIAEGESEKDFLIRTGKVTPFAGQKGYERRQAAPVRRLAAANVSTSEEGVQGGGSEGGRATPAKRQRTTANEPSTSLTNDPEQCSVASVRKAHFLRSGKGDADLNDDDDYIPDQSGGEEDDEESWEPEKSESAKRKRKRHSSLVVNFAEDADGELSQEPQDNEILEDPPLETREGSDWEPDDGEELEFDGGLRIPASLYDRLFDYQKTGVQWLWELHSQGTGGILGDEMGLGKTIQIVAFLAALDYSGKLNGSVIVLAPTTVLRQWYREFRAWWPRFRVRVLHHSHDQQQHGQNNRRRSGQVKFNPNAILKEATSQRHGVLITSYEQVRKHYEKLLDKFEYVIADEGHKMKSPDAEITLVCKRFDTPHRIIVSGSPLQNHLKELWSLFDFVYPGKLGTLPVFQAQFIVPITMGGYSTASKAQVHAAYKCSLVLRDLISPYLLRRMKKDVAAQLPEKNEQILFVKLTFEQREKYRQFLKSRFVRQVLNGKLNLLYAITALRKICNHTDIPLHKNDHDNAYVRNGASRGRRSAPVFISEADKEDPTKLEDYGNWKRSGKMVVLDRILNAWQKTSSRVLLFSQTRTMLDILEIFIKERGYTYQRMDGETSIGLRMGLIDTFNRDESVFLFLLTTRVGGLGVNLTGADKVVLFDPDWNPSTDLQARERAWRVGQKRPVTVYRLITSGTIEEKIYHRQIYKQFLTNKVLNDPRQRRFFKQKDIKDLFTLAEDDERGTETGDLFAGTAAKEQISREKSNIENGFMEKSDSRDENKKSTEAGNATLLNSLLEEFGDGALQSTINHDAIMGAGTEMTDASLLEHEADMIASNALEEVNRSGQRRRRENVGVPTWTGKSGLAGFVSPGLGGGNGGSKAASILQRIRQRESAASMTGVLAGDSEMSASAALLSEIIEFLRERGGESTSTEVVRRFQARVNNNANGAQGFKAMLKKVAVLKKGEGPKGTSVWKLLSKFTREN